MVISIYSDLFLHFSYHQEINFMCIYNKNKETELTDACLITESVVCVYKINLFYILYYKLQNTLVRENYPKKH